MTFETICKYCGDECYDDEMHNGDICKTCYVENCNHTNIYRELGDAQLQRKVEVLEHCLDCKAFRYHTFYYTGTNQITSTWDHDEVHIDES